MVFQENNSKYISWRSVFLKCDFDILCWAPQFSLMIASIIPWSTFSEQFSAPFEGKHTFFSECWTLFNSTPINKMNEWKSEWKKLFQYHWATPPPHHFSVQIGVLNKLHSHVLQSCCHFEPGLHFEFPPTKNYKKWISLMLLLNDKKI